jgi:DNA (cytosine-5)-methyltransferase 1
MANKKKKLNIVSLFSGCGGLDLGFHLADHNNLKFNLIWANDFFKSACKTFEKNFKVNYYENPEEGVKKPSIYCGDISNFKFKEKLGNKNVDGVLGGFPCQDFSMLRGHNSRGGINVKRGRLYMHFVRALIELQPKFFVAENVRGLVSANKGYAFKRILNDFENLNLYGKEIEADCGYKIEKNGIKGYHIVHKDVVDFSKVGVPQRRQRLIIIGIRKDLIDETQKVEISKRFKELLKNNLFNKFPLTTLEIFSGKPIHKLNGEYKDIISPFIGKIEEIDSKRKKEFVEETLPVLSLNAKKDYIMSNSISRKKSFDEAMQMHDQILLSLGYSNKPVDQTKFFDNSHNVFNEMKTVSERMAHIPPGENHEFVKGTQYNITGLMSNIYKRIHPLKPSYTVIANGGGGTWGYHYSINRQRLTNRERARIQTFPDWFMFKGKPSEIRTQLGNAVPPFGVKPFAEELLDIFHKIA